MGEIDFPQCTGGLPPRRSESQPARAGCSIRVLWNRKKGTAGNFQPVTDQARLDLCLTVVRAIIGPEELRIEVARVLITDAGRRALAGRAK